MALENSAAIPKQTREEADDTDVGFVGDLPLPAVASPPQPQLQSDIGSATSALESNDGRNPEAEVAERGSDTAEIDRR